MKNKKRISIFLFLIILLSISIGFAILSRQLNIFGTSNIFASSWNIHWDNVANEKGIIPVKSAYIKDEAKTLVEYEVNFTDPGDYYEFTVDAVNEGTMDAELVIIESKVNKKDVSTLPSYLEYSVKYADGTEPQIGDVLAKKVGDVPGRKTYKVKIYFNEETFTEEMLENMPDNGLDLVFTFSAKYKQLGIGTGAEKFKDDSWDVIAEEGVLAAKQEEVVGGKCGKYNIGDTKEIDLGDLGKHTVRIANCSTPAICSTEGFSQTACGFVLEFTDIISMHRMNAYGEGATTTIGVDTNGGWEYSDMRAYVNSGFYAYEGISYSTSGIYNRLSDELKSVIADTYAVSGYGTRDVEQKNFTTIDKLYLLDSREVYGTSFDNPQNSARAYERQLDYYAENNTIVGDGPAAIKKDSQGNATDWWNRSANSGINRYFFSVEKSIGTWGDYYAHFEKGVSPAFRLK